MKKAFKGKFIALFVCFIVGSVVSFLFLFKAISDQKTDGLIINMAGRQRMLTQKFTNEFFDTVIPNQIRHSALKTAEIATTQIMEDRAKFTKTVFGKLEKELKGLSGGRELSDVMGSIPLPVTFAQEVSEKINQTGVYRYDFLSRWNINKGKGLKTEFEKDAFNFLLKNKGKPYYKFLEYEDQFVLRYATSDVASAAPCVWCHNSHPDSPKQDFKLGDLMGVLVATVPITKDVGLGRGMFAGIEGSGQDGKANEEKSYVETKKVFEKTMDALIRGGDVPSGLAMSKIKKLPATENPAIVSQLQHVNGIWKEIQGHVKDMETSEINSPEYLASFMKLRKINVDVVDAMNKAVEMYEAESDKNMAKLQKLQIGSFVLTIIAIALGWIILFPIKMEDISGK